MNALSYTTHMRMRSIFARHFIPQLQKAVKAKKAAKVRFFRLPAFVSCVGECGNCARL